MYATCSRLRTCAAYSRLRTHAVCSVVWSLGVYGCRNPAFAFHASGIGFNWAPVLSSPDTRIRAGLDEATMNLHGGVTRQGPNCGSTEPLIVSTDQGRGILRGVPAHDYEEQISCVPIAALRSQERSETPSIPAILAQW